MCAQKGDDKMALYKYKNLTKESGVYGIFLEGINMVYIGSCKHFNERWSGHLGRHRRHENDTKAELLFAKGEELGIEPYMKILEVTNDDKEIYRTKEYKMMQEYANNGWYVVNYRGMRDSYGDGGRERNREYSRLHMRERMKDPKEREKRRESVRKYNKKRYAKAMQERIDKRLAEGKTLTKKQKEFLNALDKNNIL